MKLMRIYLTSTIRASLVQVLIGIQNQGYGPPTVMPTPDLIGYTAKLRHATSNHLNLYVFDTLIIQYTLNQRLVRLPFDEN